MICNINNTDKYIAKTELTTVNIKKAREKAGLTQQELADKLGVGQLSPCWNPRRLSHVQTSCQRWRRFLNAA